MNIPSGKLTNGLIILNVVIFLIVWLAGMEQDAFARGGFFPFRLGGDPTEFSGMDWLVPAWLTPLSSAFLHSGFMHISFNMLMLFFCGRFVEHALGPGLMALLYLIGAYAASLAEFAVDTQSMIPVVGASGAISAIFGAYAMLYSRNEIKSIGPVPGHFVRIAWLTVFWIGIQMMIGFAMNDGLDGIAIYAHIGGFVAGLLLTKPLLEWRFRNA